MQAGVEEALEVTAGLMIFVIIPVTVAVTGTDKIAYVTGISSAHTHH